MQRKMILSRFDNDASYANKEHDFFIKVSTKIDTYPEFLKLSEEARNEIMQYIRNRIESVKFYVANKGS